MMTHWLSSSPKPGLPLDPCAEPLPSSAGVATRDAAGAALLGLVSAGLVGWALGAWQTAVLYAALVLSGAAISFAAARGRVRGVQVATDWAVVRAALGARDDALAITDEGGRLVCANEAFAARCGGYRSPFELGPPGSALRAAVARVAAQARQDGSGEAEALLSIDGQARSLEILCRPADGAGRHLLWTLQRSASDRLFDDAVALVEGPVGAAAGSAGLLVALVEREGGVLASNMAFRAAVARASEPIAIGDVVAMTDGRPSGLRRRDGEIDPMHIVHAPMRVQADGDVRAALWLFLPGAPECEASATLDSVPALLAALPLGLALADRKGHLVFTNKAFGEIAHLSETAPLGHSADLVVDEDKPLVADTIRRAATGQTKPRDLRVRLMAQPDEQSILTVARAPGLGAADVVLSLRDNREQLKLERQIAQATKMQAVGQLAGGVAHDFNNILTAVIGYCDLMLMRHTLGDADFDDINQIRQNANRAANLVRQLLAFSRQQTLRPQVLQVSDVVGDLSHLLKRLLGETISLTVKHGRNLGPVRADPGQLEQVIVNLAVNARDAMPNGGRLEIATSMISPDEVAKLGYEMMPPAPYVVVAVQDSGHGIPSTIIGKIFEPFFTTKEVGKGTGLGLSTVYGIVKQTGGFIFAENVGEGGARFTIYLPVCAEARPTAKPPVEERSPMEPWGRGTILLVEDEGTVRAVAERALARKGYEVLTAANGEEALDLLEGRPEGVDLLISDVVMPTMDGPTLVGYARQRFPALRILFMSGYAEEQLRRSIDLPGMAFLPKPFSVRELGDAVQSVLARETA